MVIKWDLMGFNGIYYPLVMTNIAVKNHIFLRENQCKWPCSIAMLAYQMVTLSLSLEQVVSHGSNAFFVDRCGEIISQWLINGYLM